MKLSYGILLSAALALIPALSLAAGIKEGQWEITSVMDMPNMPMKMPPQTVKHCYTKEDVSDQRKVINRDKNCTVKDYKVSGSKVTWTVVCTGPNSGTMNGETVFSDTSYTSTMKMKSQGQNMTMKVKGKRIGNCP